jgi:hypothetical protein
MVTEENHELSDTSNLFLILSVNIFSLTKNVMVTEENHELSDT